MDLDQAHEILAKQLKLLSERSHKDSVSSHDLAEMTSEMVSIERTMYPLWH